MICSCPKCQAQIDIEPSKVPDSGTFLPCLECKSRFWIAKQAYARMSLKKEGLVYCDQCGKELEHKIVCGACGVMYPDYYIVQSSKPPLRQVEKRDIFSVGFALKPGRQIQSYDYTYTSSRESTGWSLGFNLQKFAVLVVVILIAAGGGYFYQVKKAEKLFAINYMRALYAIKTGNDLSVDTCAKVSANWKEKGSEFVPRISADDEERLNRVKIAADRYMSKLNNPPKKYIANKQNLTNLYDIYSRTYTLATAPSGSLPSFDSSVAKSQNDFNSSAATLKQNMPGALSEEFQVAKRKYRGLQKI